MASSNCPSTGSLYFFLTNDSYSLMYSWFIPLHSIVKVTCIGISKSPCTSGMSLEGR